MSVTVQPIGVGFEVSATRPRPLYQGPLLLNLVYFPKTCAGRQDVAVDEA
jgi:hypothetical protein